MLFQLGKSEGGIDAGQMIKPALARGLQLVGATTPDEYRKTIGKDAALERRFQPVTIEEPTVASTISILRGLKPRYEVHHGVEISDSALVTGRPLIYLVFCSGDNRITHSCCLRSAVYFRKISARQSYRLSRRGSICTSFSTRIQTRRIRIPRT